MRLHLKFLGVVVLGAIPWFALGQTVHMNILLNDSPQGENTFIEKPDGTFSSKTTLRIGNISIGGAVTGKLVKGN